MSRAALSVAWIGYTVFQGLVVASLTGALVMASSPEEQESASVLTDSFSHLKTRAGQGRVRVIAKVRTDMSQVESPDKGQALESNKVAVTRAMQQAGAIYAEPLAGLPYVVMELTASELDQLLSTGLVESIQEDRLNRLQ